MTSRNVMPKPVASLDMTSCIELHCILQSYIGLCRTVLIMLQVADCMTPWNVITDVIGHDALRRVVPYFTVPYCTLSYSVVSCRRWQTG